MTSPRARRLLAIADQLVRRSLWIVGGDGWAYDIGFGGLDHVLGSGRDVNVLVLDTEVYSNTGGQASKATPRAAVAKFAAAGKGTQKKDLGAFARAYGNVFVAQVALGANDAQTVQALLEAEAWHGPSLVIAYSTCIAHGIDMSTSMRHQKDAVQERLLAAVPIPPVRRGGRPPFQLDAAAPTIPVADFVAAETRFAVLARTHPERAAELAELRQTDTDERWHYYEQLAGVERTVPHLSGEPWHGAVARAATSRIRGMSVDLTPATWDSTCVRRSSPPRHRATPTSPMPSASSMRASGPSSSLLFEDEVSSSRRALVRARDATGQFAEASGYFPTIDAFTDASERYAMAILRLKVRMSVPIIGSLNASTPRGLGRYAQLIQDAGADAIELNLYRVALRPRAVGARPGAGRPRRHRGVRAASTSRSPSTSRRTTRRSPSSPTWRYGAGADGLVLFNRLYQPDIDPERWRSCRIELSTPAELRLPVRWIACCAPGRPRASLAATSGVHSGGDVVKALAVGADVVMMTSAILRYGAGTSPMSKASCAAGSTSGSTGRSRNCAGAPSRGRPWTGPASSARTTSRRSGRGRRLPGSRREPRRDRATTAGARCA